MLDALSRALRLDDVETVHLRHLVLAANATRSSRGPARRDRVRPSVQQVLDSMATAAAFVRNGGLDILATNRLADAL